jgi:hypothetical protein
MSYLAVNHEQVIESRLKAGKGGMVAPQFIQPRKDLGVNPLGKAGMGLSGPHQRPRWTDLGDPPHGLMSQIGI